ncbi:MAG: Hsp20/alpha crystallin family protein [Acidobacteriota bacterium]
MRKMLSSFLDVVRLQSQMNQLFEALQSIQQDESQADVGFTAPYDVVEGKDHLLVYVDVPGMAPESLSVLGGGGTLVIQGERPRFLNPELQAYHLLERDRGPFRKTIHLDGAWNTHQATATYEKGVLCVRLPRVSERRGRMARIPVNP